MFAAVHASPNAVQVLALVAAVVFVIAGLLALLRPQVGGTLPLVAGGLAVLAVAVIYLV